MFRRLSVALTLSLLVSGLAFSAVSAEEGMTDPEPTVEQMMAEMMIDRVQMMAEIQTWLTVLPPGVVAMVTEPIHHLTDDELMMLHYELHHTALLQEPPGQFMRYIQSFGHSGH